MWMRTAFYELEEGNLNRSRIPDEALKWYENYTEEIQYLPVLATLLTNISPMDPNVDDVSTKDEPFIFSCSYNNKKCTSKHIKQYRDPNFLNCYTCNPNLEDETGQASNSAGFADGLTLVLFVGNNLIRTMPTKPYFSNNSDVSISYTAMGDPFKPPAGVEGVRVMINTPGRWSYAYQSDVIWK